MHHIPEPSLQFVLNVIFTLIAFVLSHLTPHITDVFSVNKYTDHNGNYKKIPLVNGFEIK